VPETTADRAPRGSGFERIIAVGGAAPTELVVVVTPSGDAGPVRSA
jgi:hypothetical protein